MIEAKDLRPGNWLMYLEDGKRVEAPLLYVSKDTNGFKGWYVCFGGCSISIEDHFNDGDIDVHPIPLSPDVLQEWGFRWVNNDWYEIKGISVELHSGYICFGEGDYLLKANILYLHQLQNLTFSLTGEELTNPAPSIGGN